jgi:uncharacterized GH25 family protein
MKLRRVTLLIVLIVAGLAARSNDYILLADNYFMHKGDVLNLHLVYADQFDNGIECKYYATQTSALTLYEGSKKTDLRPMANDSTAPLLQYKLSNAGTALMEMTRNAATLEMDKASYIKFLDEEGLTKMSARADQSSSAFVKEKSTICLKTIFNIDKPGGNLQNKPTGQEIEIALDKNPYKATYGDDLTALLSFKGKPLPNRHVDVFIKTQAGKVYTQQLITDSNGNVFFKLNRNGIYLLRSVNVEPAAVKGFDFEEWEASYTFAFNNSGDSLNK